MDSDRDHAGLGTTTGAATPPEAIAALSHGVLLQVFGEQDAARRAEAIQRIFAEDVRFIDHNGAHVGRAEIASAVESLHARMPDFRFTPVSEPQLLEGAARLSWSFGPPKRWANNPAQKKPPLYVGLARPRTATRFYYHQMFILLHHLSRTPRPPLSETAPSLINWMPLADSASINFISESTLLRTTPSEDSIR